MIRWRERLQQIGGRNAITWWSWIVSIPLAMLVSSTYAGTPSSTDVLVWQSIVVAVQIFLGLLMWLGWKTILPNTKRASRPVVALIFFGVLGLTRGLAMQIAQEIVGISGGVFSERLAVNIVGSMVALSAIAIIVDDYRTDAAIVQRLARAQAVLARLRDREESDLRAADIEVLEQVQERINTELTTAGASPERVRDVAEEVVRPISHALAGQAADLAHLEADESGPKVKLTFGQAFGRMKAPSPLAVAVLVEGTVLGAVAVRYGMGVAVGNLVLGGSLTYLGCWLISKFCPLPKRPIGRLLTLALALAAVGAAATELTALVITPLNSTFPAGLIGVTGGVTSAGLALSLLAAVNSGRQLRQQEMAHAVAQEALGIERMRNLVEQRRLQAARFLHGTIQGELVAAALRNDTPSRVTELMSQRFAEYGTVQQRSVEQQVHDVTSAWSQILNISLNVDTSCWDQLESDGARASLLMDALSEGLTNVVRHSSGKDVTIDVTTADQKIKLTVMSQGDADGSHSPGIGLAQLRARGAQVELTTRELNTHLTVVL